MSYTDGIPLGAPSVNGVEQAAFLAPVAARLAGLTYGRLDYLARRGFLRPSVVDAAGSGTRRRYSFTDVVALRTVARLREAGVSLDALRGVVAFLRTREEADPLVGTRLVVDGDRVLVLETDGQMMALLREEGHRALRLVVDVGAVVRELRAELAAPSPAAAEVPSRSA